MKCIDLMNDWLENYHKPYIKRQTYMRYRSNINNYVAGSFLGEMEIEDITRKDVQDFVNQLVKRISPVTGKPLSGGTIHNAYILIQSAMNYAEDYDLIEKSPCHRIRQPVRRTPTDTIKCFTLQEQQKIEQELIKRNDPELFGILLCLYTGLRIGELCALRWSDVDFAESTLYVKQAVYSSKDDDGTWRAIFDTPKSPTSVRYIPIPRHLMADLKRHHKQSESAYVVSFADGRFMPPWSMRYRYENLLADIGVRRLNFHCLRHTFATRAMEAGVDFRTLADVMGHSDPSITIIYYQHATKEHVQEMMNKIKRVYKEEK